VCQSAPVCALVVPVCCERGLGLNSFWKSGLVEGGRAGAEAFGSGYSPLSLQRSRACFCRRSNGGRIQWPRQGRKDAWGRGVRLHGRLALSGCRRARPHSRPHALIRPATSPRATGRLASRMGAALILLPVATSLRASGRTGAGWRDCAAAHIQTHAHTCVCTDMRASKPVRPPPV
jgi:hypothetical protein